MAVAAHMDSNDPNNNPNTGSDASIVPGQPVSPAVDFPQAPVSVTPSPWDPIPAQTPTPAPGFMPTATPAETPAAPLTEFPPITSTTAADVPTAPAAPEMPSATPDVSTTNPFLQPQSNTAFSAPVPMDPTPAQTPADPLNTAFTPGAAPENPFGAGSTALPADPSQPVAPGSPNPWDQPAPAATPPADPVSPSLNLMGQPGNPAVETAQIHDQSIPASSPSAPPDLSSAAPEAPATTPDPSGIPASPEQIPAPASPLPDMGPVENAPTDLSHLIAGDETTPQTTNGVYTPPVAADQNLPVDPAQAPLADGQTPPPGKHLNLTKVLLVAGIPVILIVAALSAYLILGVGQASPSPEDSTSLPVEQTQAPLTNPPQQIVAPSPVTIPEPSDASLPTTDLVPSASPEASLSPAMRAAQQKASASPNSSASPAASSSTSLPQ